MSDSDLVHQNPVEMIQRLRHNAEILRQWARDTYGEHVGYDRAGVRWLGRHINAMQSTGVIIFNAREVSLYGAFLGECLCHIYPAQWQQRGNTWVAQSARGTTQIEAHVFEKVQKQLRYGAIDNVEGLLEVFDYYLAGALPTTDARYIHMAS